MKAQLLNNSMACSLCRHDISVISGAPRPSQASLFISQIPPTIDRPETRAPNPFFHKRPLNLCTSGELSTFAFLVPGDGSTPSVCPGEGRDLNAFAYSAFSHVDISWMEAEHGGSLIFFMTEDSQRARGCCALIPSVEIDNALHVFPVQVRKSG